MFVKVRIADRDMKEPTENGCDPAHFDDRAITRFKTPGMHRVADNLYVHVSKKGARDWIFRYRGTDGRRHDMGLGYCALFGFDETVAAAIECRRLLYRGLDPIEHRRQLQANERAEKTKLVTREECLDRFAEKRKAKWSTGYTKKWRDTLDRYAGDLLARLSIDAVADAIVIRGLTPAICR
jgi:hypothetical protein